MHVVYKAISPKEVDRIVAYCKQPGLGMFEVYPGEEASQVMVIINSTQENEPLEKFKPLGSFYCNYLGVGVISLDEQEPEYDAMPSARDQVKVIKQVIDTLIEKAYPEAKINFSI